MKKLFFVLFCVFFVVGCGSDSPDNVAKDFIEYLNKGDIEKALKCTEFIELEGNEGKAKAKDKLSDMSKSFLNHTNKQGGFKNVEVASSNIDNDTAQVRLQINFKNGTSESEDFNLYKKDSKWYLDFGYISSMRDDAELTKSVYNLTILISDLTSYYTTKGVFNNDFKEMTNVTIGENGEFYVGKQPCLKIDTKDKSIIITNINTTNNKLCTNVMRMDIIKQTLKGVDLSKKNSTTINL